MPSVRQQKVGELLKRALGEAIRREFNVSTAGLISVHEVEIAGDLKSAVVYFSVLGSPEQQKRAPALLAEHRIRLQGLIAKSVILKYTPTLRFVLDDSVNRGNRVMQILEELENEPPRPGPTTSAE